MDKNLNCARSIAKMGIMLVSFTAVTKIIVDKAVDDLVQREQKYIEQISQPPEQIAIDKMEPIINSVLTYYNIPEDEIFAGNKGDGGRLARKVIYYLCHEDAGINCDMISTCINDRYSNSFDHSIIIHGVIYVRNRIKENDTALIRQIADIRAILSQSQTSSQVQQPGKPARHRSVRIQQIVKRQR